MYVVIWPLWSYDVDLPRVQIFHPLCETSLITASSRVCLFTLLFKCVESMFAFILACTNCHMHKIHSDMNVHEGLTISFGFRCPRSVSRPRHVRHSYTDGALCPFAECIAKDCCSRWHLRPSESLMGRSVVISLTSWGHLVINDDRLRQTKSISVFHCSALAYN